MTDSTFGIRGISRFARTAQGRRQFAARDSDRSLAKHAGAREEGDETAQPPALDAGRLVDITV